MTVALLYITSVFCIKDITFIISRIISKAGAWRDLCNDKNQSPADAARKAGDEELAEFLKVEKCAAPLDPYAKAIPAAGGSRAPERTVAPIPSVK